MATSPMVTIVEDFLSDLARAGKSAHTVRAYRSDLRDFGRFFTGPIERITTGVLRQYLRGLAGKAPATRARREAASHPRPRARYPPNRSRPFCG